MTPTIAIRIAITAIERTITFAVEIRRMMVCFTCARPVQYAANFELDVLLRHKDHVTYLTLFKFCRLITHNCLISFFIGKPSTLPEFEKGLHFAKTFWFYSQVGGYPAP